MAQVFDRSSNALARFSLVLTGVIVIALGVTLDSLQRSPWVTRQGQRPDQPVPFSHKHHVVGLGLQCQYCHTSVEKSSYAGIPPTKTCINCHSQIWTNAQLLEPVRQSWATGASIQWIKVHDLPDYVYFNHSVHVNKGIGCASCHGRVDEMPLMYQQNTLQMEWCLNCHRNPGVNLRPTSEIYNMAWAGPSSDRPVWCADNATDRPTAQNVNCTTKDPTGSNPEVAMLQNSVGEASGNQSQSGTMSNPHPSTGGEGKTYSDGAPMGAMVMPANYKKFTSQAAMGKYLTDQYHIPHPGTAFKLRDVSSMKEQRKPADEQLMAARDKQTEEAMEETNKISAPVVVTKIGPAKLTLAQVQAKLDGKTGRRFWKDLDSLAETESFHELMAEEFPRQSMGASNEWVDPVSRRGFLKVMGASFALAGLAGCTKQPDEPIYPYVKQPEDLVLGTTMLFATAHPFPTGAIPVLVKTDAFRPIKLEGNPEHPMSKGKSDALTQATLLGMYDPDRSQHVMYRGETSSWGKFQNDFATAAKQTQGGQGIYFLSETVTSPTLATQWKQVQQKYPQAKLVQWEPVNQDASRAASKAAFGEYMDAQYKLEDADVILSLDADFLGGIAHPGFLPLAAAYAERHRYEEGKTPNRLYVVETMPTVTGFKAEHRLGLKPSDLVGFATALAGGSAPASMEPDAQKFMTSLLADLKANSGKAVVIPGEQAPASVHAAAYALNAAIGAVGKTVVYTETVNPLPSEQLADLKALVADMNAGKVSWLVVMGVNPVYSAPADLNFVDAYNKVPTTAHLGTHRDETGFISTYHINSAHFLESWSDARAYDGTISIIQPMIAPLYDGKSAHDVFQALLDDPQASGFDVVTANAKTYIKGDFAAGWRKALHDGWVEGTAFTPKGSTPKAAIAANSAPASGSGYELSFKPDSSLYDGRYANVGWLQELSKQVTSMSWDNAAMMSMATMADLKTEETDIIEITLDGRKVTAPVFMVPGHPDGVITLHLGFGRRVEAGRVGAAVGFDAYKLRTADMPLYATGATAKKIAGTYDLCVTKVHNIEHRGAYAQRDLEHPLSDKKGTYSLAGHEAMERAIIRYATLDQVKQNPNFAHELDEQGHGLPGSMVGKVGYSPQGENPGKDDTFFPDNWNYQKQDPSSRKIQNAWGMAIDLNSCVGCNACIVSCYAENNVAVVGREQVKVGRNMQWIRIDTYFEGDLHAPKAHFQPMMCQHCENAGCEQVCPVGATVHTPEGINTMVYNRCVGTRYCSNNCPYKVRRFNFLLYSDYDTESLKFMRNPDVSVRSRGVMEKCSYCIQRIEAAKIDADKENRAIRDGEIVTACQQACPTSAITFGNINDKESKVAKMKAKERDYPVLADLNFHPRTTYTAGVINPNPELA